MKRIWFLILILIAITLGLLAGITFNPLVGEAAELPPALIHHPHLLATTGIDLKSPQFADPLKLRFYLEAQGSPLAEYSVQIANSQFWALIIGVCSIEQYNCSKAPYNNYWGMMTSGGLRHFASLDKAISYMDSYFTKLYTTRKTVESLRGYYCQSECTNWYPVVLRVKKTLENL